MAFLLWKDQYSVGVEEMNRQHQKLIGMINDLHDAMSQGKGSSVLQDLLGRMSDYTSEHFKSEEELMSKYNYPGLDAQIQAHKAFVEKIHDFQQKFSKGQILLSLEVMSFLRDWLIQHIGKMDKEYADFFHQHGVQ